eukprot:scaffold179_cov368-Prasinococcus_capsulatus_cf.AAC.39
MRSRGWRPRSVGVGERASTSRACLGLTQLSRGSPLRVTAQRGQRASERATRRPALAGQGNAQSQFRVASQGRAPAAPPTTSSRRPGAAARAWHGGLRGRSLVVAASSPLLLLRHTRRMYLPPPRQRSYSRRAVHTYIRMPTCRPSSAFAGAQTWHGCCGTTILEYHPPPAPPGPR